MIRKSGEVFYNERLDEIALSKRSQYKGIGYLVILRDDMGPLFPPTEFVVWDELTMSYWPEGDGWQYIGDL